MADPHSRAGWGWLCACAAPARSFVLRAARRLPLIVLIFGGLTIFLGTIAPTGTLAANDAEVRMRGAASDATANAEASETVTGRPAPAALPGTTAEPEPTTGEMVVATALLYVGYPYVAGGNTPAGFDCAGFAHFVLLTALGIDIGSGLPSQTAAGLPVEWGDWRAGDLVFFANTYQPGLSHVGIYIGDGQFIHAGDESTGVLISSMYEEYYATRYDGSVRIG